MAVQMASTMFFYDLLGFCSFLAVYPLFRSSSVFFWVLGLLNFFGILYFLVFYGYFYNNSVV